MLFAHAEAGVDERGYSSGSVRQRLARFLRRTFAALDETSSAMRGLMAYAQEDPAFRAVFLARFIEPRRRTLSALLRTCIDQGLLPYDADIDAGTLALFGCLWYRLLLDEPLDARYADRVATLVVDGLTADNAAR